MITGDYPVTAAQRSAYQADTASYATVAEELLATSTVYREIYEHGLLERQFADAVEVRAEMEGVA